MNITINSDEDEMESWRSEAWGLWHRTKSLEYKLKAIGGDCGVPQRVRDYALGRASYLRRGSTDFY